MTTPKRENVWNQLLFEKSRAQKYTNKNVVILGRKGAGKRTLVDSLGEISKTVYPKNTQLAGKLRIKGVTPLLDYTYLNVIDQNDPDYATNARLNISIIDDDSYKYLLGQALSQLSIRNTFFVIALDMQEPWTFMEDLDRWISVLQDLREDVKLTLSELEQMKSELESYIREYNQKDEEQLKQKMPLREGLPFMVVVLKSDILEKDDKGKDWDDKAELIQFNLRKFCLTYGACLMVTSAKSKTNLEAFYYYLLHRLYKMPQSQRELPDLQNIESLFVPVGMDDQSLLRSTYQKAASKEVRYEEAVPQIQLKKNQQREELICEDDQEFFSKLKEKCGQIAPKPTLPLSIPKLDQAQTAEANGASSARGQNQQLVDFYNKILTKDVIQPEKTLTNKAQEQLHERIRQTKAETIGPNTVKPFPLFNQSDQQALSKIITQNQDSNRGSTADFAAIIKSKNSAQKDK